MDHDSRRVPALRRGLKFAFVLPFAWHAAAYAQPPGNADNGFGIAEDGASGVNWEVRADSPAGGRLDRSELVFTAHIAEGWILYSSDFKEGLGPRPARFSVQPSSAVTAIGPVRAVNSRARDDRTFGTRYTFFEHQGEFRQRLEVKERPAVITGRIEGQACHEADGTCTLIHKEFSLRLE